MKHQVSGDSQATQRRPRNRNSLSLNLRSREGRQRLSPSDQLSKPPRPANKRTTSKGYSRAEARTKRRSTNPSNTHQTLKAQATQRLSYQATPAKPDHNTLYITYAGAHRPRFVRPYRRSTISVTRRTRQIDQKFVLLGRVSRVGL